MYTRETGGVLTPQGEINQLESAAVPPEVTVRFTNTIYIPRVYSTNVQDYKKYIGVFLKLKKNAFSCMHDHCTYGHVQYNITEPRVVRT